MASLPTTRTILAVQILTLFAGSLGAVDVAGGGVVEAVHRGQREFDYFVLALQWPGTFCRRTRQCCSSNACCRGANTPSEFTIHGLWPDYNDGSWPACCTRSSFDVKEIATLREALEKYWPSLSCGMTSTCHGGKGLFWAHEIAFSIFKTRVIQLLTGDLRLQLLHFYRLICLTLFYLALISAEKHGTCSSPVVRDEYNYFLTTLNVYFKYNVTEVLKEAGYVPSNSEKYPLGGIISAIQNAFHTTPLLICSKGAVQELRLCFYKDFKPRDCVNATSSRADMISSKSSCPSYVSLPAYTSVALGRVSKCKSFTRNRINQGWKMVGLHTHGYLTRNLIDTYQHGVRILMASLEQLLPD
ncbi:hypothetical protein RJ640_025294 [Escallonia rubra]|uniref:Uncharacterized protein n=1 Tax=Escallonia rubra TaxID=112253 RepID=A0AA88QK49_9ASTE|nr:hypothetical protein RJ640_025294 [Escallonia rubra]